MKSNRYTKSTTIYGRRITLPGTLMVNSLSEVSTAGRNMNKEECEEKLVTLIWEVKAEIADAKAIL